MNPPEPPPLAAIPQLPLDPEGPVFAEPWQAQAFALAVQLHAGGVFTWPEWAEALSDELNRAPPGDDGSRYYEHWLATLERLAIRHGLASDDALQARKAAWESAYRHTPHGQPVELSRSSV